MNCRRITVTAKPVSGARIVGVGNRFSVKRLALFDSAGGRNVEHEWRGYYNVMPISAV